MSREEELRHYWKDATQEIYTKMIANAVIPSDPLAPYAAGSTEPWAVSVLEALVRLRRPMNLLELGTFEGRTTRALASVMPEHARLWTVDITRRHEGFDDRRITYTEAGAIEWLIHDAPEGAIDFAFVDDDHSLGHVAQEVAILREHVMAPRGLIVLHDVIGPFGLDEIVKAHDGFIVELPLLHAAGGLGIIQCD